MTMIPQLLVTETLQFRLPLQGGNRIKDVRHALYLGKSTRDKDMGYPRDGIAWRQEPNIAV